MLSNFSSSVENIVDLSSIFNRSLLPKYRVRSQANGWGKTRSTNKSSRVRSYTVIAVVEGRGNEKGHLGIAAMDLRYPDVELYEFIDSTAYSRLKAKVQMFDPIEIIVAASINDKSATLLLIEAIKTAFPDVTITTVQRRYFNNIRGAELVKQLANKEISNCDALILQKQLCMSCCAALLKYIEHIQNIVFSSGALRFTFKDVENMCMIDLGSWKNLEIVDEFLSKDHRSLMSIINKTLTPSGARLLRSNLLQPSTDKPLIEARLDAVEELIDDPHLLERLRKIIARVYELDHVLAMFIRTNSEVTVQSAEYNITQLLHLRRTLHIVEPLRQVLSNVKSQLLVNNKNHLNDSRLDELIEILDDRINSDVLSTNKKNSITIRNQKCYAVKEGLSINLDVARKAYEELLKDIQTQQLELNDHLPNENTRLSFSATRGFHYTWVSPQAGTIKLPSIFINEVRNRSSITFTSRSLIRYNDRIEQSVCEVLLAGDIVIQQIIENMRPHAAVLYYVMDAIANIDFLCSLAVYASTTQSVRPRFGTSVMLKGARHPLLDHSMPDRVVPNDTYLTPDSRFAIITGPNMAGKSTYLKQVSQLCLMAQMGSMVPAQIAVLPIFTRVFSRIGHNDCLAQNLSAFAVEMSEMAVILQYANERSLIVIDELARSTSTEEGIGISHAIAEKLLKLGAFTIFATHFLDIAILDISYSAVENYHFSPQVKIDEDGDEMVDPSHKLYKGPYTGPLYGFELVELSTFPADVVRNAREIANRLRAESINKRTVDADVLLRRALVKTAHRLRHAVTMGKAASRESIIKYIGDLRKHFLLTLEDIATLSEGN